MLQFTNKRFLKFYLKVRVIYLTFVLYCRYLYMHLLRQIFRKAVSAITKLLITFTTQQLDSLFYETFV